MGFLSNSPDYERSVAGGNEEQSDVNEQIRIPSINRAYAIHQDKE